MIYTKTGDAGTTSLIGGTHVSKCHPRVEAYGTVDELNAHLGLLAEMLRAALPDQYSILKEAQRSLFAVQTLLAAEPECGIDLPALPSEAVGNIERAIDALQELLPQPRRFVIPGGNAMAAQCHVARTVCRRAERCIVALSANDPCLPYVNRLSDYLFVLSRHLVLSQGDEESLY